MSSRRYRRTTAVHLVLFHTEGEPHDSGTDLTNSASHLVKLAQGNFASVEVFTPSRLIFLDEVWRERFTDYTERILADPLYSESLHWKKSWAKVGLQSWKPWLIALRLSMDDVAPGDIVLYHDADTERYPDYVEGVDQWATWISKKMKNLDVLAFDDNGARLSSEAKPELVERLLSDRPIEDLPHLWSGALAVKKNSLGIRFIQLWANQCTYDNLSPVTRVAGAPWFAQHAVDQAVLGCVWWSPRLVPQKTRRKVAYLHRSRKIPPPSTGEFFSSTIQSSLRKTFRALKRTLHKK